MVVSTHTDRGVLSPTTTKVGPDQIAVCLDVDYITSAGVCIGILNNIFTYIICTTSHKGGSVIIVLRVQMTFGK